jgi:hypothetical protein
LRIREALVELVQLASNTAKFLAKLAEVLGEEEVVLAGLRRGRRCPLVSHR